MDREALLDDVQWDLIEPFLPPQRSGKGRPMRDHRQVVEGVIYRYRCGIAWRDLPSSFGPWQTVWKRHHRFSTDGTWDKIHARLLAEAQAAGDIDWMVSVDSTINRAHQHATNASRVEEPAGRPHRVRRGRGRHSGADDVEDDVRGADRGVRTPEASARDAAAGGPQPQRNDGED